MEQELKSIDLFVPGRLCLLGEHSDWSGLYRSINSEIPAGLAIVTGIEQGIYANATRSDRFIIETSLPEYKDESFSCAMSVAELKRVAIEGGYFSYVAGVASYMKENYRVGGVKIEIKRRTLPMKRGLSSSAAICVLVARAFNDLYHLNLSTLGEMQIAYMGEQRTPSRCGRLDQACAFGTKPILMTFDGNETKVERLRIKKPLYWVYADLQGNKDTIKILGDLNRCYPFPQNAIDENVHQALGVENRRIVSQAAAAIEAGDVQTLGRLLNEAQEVFDKKVAPACPAELTAPKLHHVLQDETVRRLTLGGKGVGSQGDGSVQFLTVNEQHQNQLVAYLNGELHLDAYAFTIQPQREVRKAIIPLAGYGTRMYPATRSIKKELFPVITPEGIAKPVLMLLLEELENSGIEEICLVVRKEDLAFYKAYFSDDLAPDYCQKIPGAMRNYENLIQNIGKKIHFVTQEEQLGFGHAVYQCRSFTGDEPVLLMLGDTIYRSRTAQTCTTQLIDAFEKNSRLTVSIQEVVLKDVQHFGVLSGHWMDEGNTLLEVSEFVEKPTPLFAEENLGVEINGDTKYYAIFGEYILTPDVFVALEYNIANHITSKNEFQLTDALATVAHQQGMFGFAVQGDTFDVGDPQMYRRTIAAFGKKG